MDVVFFIYGLAFFALGLVVLVQPKEESRYELPRFIWLLALFGLVHGTLEWLDLWRIVRGNSATLSLLKVVFLFVSYAFLFEFGRRLTQAICDQTPAIPNSVGRMLGKPIYGVVALGFLFEFLMIPDGILAITIASRYFLGFVGSSLASIGFLLCLNKKREGKPALSWSVKYFVLAAVAFILYGVLGGLVVPPADVIPANVINDQWFLATFLLPVQLFRATCAVLAAIAIGNILRIFHLEGRERFQSTLMLAKESEAKLQEINSVLADGVYVLDSNGLVTFFNPEAERLLGWSAAELLGKNGHETFHYKTPEGLPISAEECPVHKTILTGQIYRSINDWLVRKDGAIVPVSIVSSPIIHDGKVMGSVAAFHDITSRQAMEKALKASEQRFRDTLENAPIGMAVAELGGKFLQVNQALCNVLGYQREELLQLSFTEITHPDDLEISYANVEKTLHGDIDSYQMEKRYIRKDGRQVWVQLSVSIQYDDAGAPQYLIGQIEDITESKLAKQALRESEERFRLISTSAKDAIIIIGSTEEITYWNPAAENIFGYPASEALGKNMHKLITPSHHRDDAHRGFAHFRTSGEGAVIGKTLELTALRQNGEEFPIELSISAFKIKDQWQALGIVRDISARKKAEQEYKTIIQTTIDGFLVVDAHEGRFLDVNDAYCRMLGYSREEILRMRISDVEAMYSPEQIKQHNAELRKIGQAQFETRHRGKDGSFIDVEISATYLDLRGGVFIVFIRDISERKRAEEQIRQLAYYDTLTNLPNRRLMLDRLNLSISQAKRHQRSMAVVFLDLDHFKQINDTLGHDVGDELLKVAATRLNACVRSGDLVSRQGGDEFVIVLAEIAHPQDAAVVAEKIVDTLGQSITIKGHELKITTSIGISVYPINGTDDTQELMKKADLAMYAAKEGGRNGYRFYQN